MSTVEPLLSAELLGQLARLELVSRKIFRGRLKGERRSPRKGQSVEFADFREYAPGDDLRFVDWNTYARLDRLFLKLFFEEEDLHFHVLLDASRSMDFGTPTKLRHAQQLAAALGFVGLVRGDRVRIETLDQSVQRGGPVFRGRGSVWQMTEWLAGIQPRDIQANDWPANNGGLLEQGTKNFCLRNPGRGIVVLISDMLDKNGYVEGLKYLLARQMDVHVIQLLSAEEIDPDVHGDLKLVDCEDQDVAEISVSGPLIARYRQTLAGYVAEIREYCTRRGMNYLLANNQISVEQLVGTYLRKRGLVR